MLKILDRGCQEEYSITFFRSCVPCDVVWLLVFWLSPNEGLAYNYVVCNLSLDTNAIMCILCDC
jgi:hypothetical protein